MQKQDKGTIDRFINDFAFLSNFHPSTIRWRGLKWKTVEHAYQAAKTLDEKQQQMIHESKTPAEAKKLGRAVTIRPDWDDVKLSIMEELIRLKFENPLLRYALLQTGERPLVEGNHWNDTTWGICRGKGQNLLGKILMKVRDECRDEEIAS